MKKGEKYFIRIDKKIDGAVWGDNDFDNHIAYLKEVAKTTTFYGGGFEHKNGGMIIFMADSLNDAIIICDNDPVIKNGLYSYDIYEWNILLDSTHS